MQHSFRWSLLPVAAILGTSPASASEMCDALSAVASHTPSAYAALRGTPRPLLDTWIKYDSNKTLSGATNCEIDGQFVKYACDWNVGSSREEKARFDQLVSEVGLCFPTASSAKTDKTQTTFWIGRRGEVGATAVDVSRLKVGGQRIVVLTVRPYK